MDNNLVTELKILDGNKNIFDSGEYIIPFYQREFAWEDKHLEQLIEDINDNEEEYYYLGSLIVNKKDDTYEVIDGQQRLTALFLLLNCLGFKVGNNLKFSCREKSNYTLKHINDKNKLDNNLEEESIYEGIKILKNLLGKLEKLSFIEKLKKVVIYRIEVPEHTDLNHYFEIMNTRGEQLEQQDILKAELMRNLTDDEDKEVFSIIWNACSDMTGYVQMHFISKGNQIRNNLFGNNWNELQLKDDFNEIKTKIISNVKDNTTSTPNQSQEFTIQDIIKSDFKIEEDNISNDKKEDARIRFESIINFPYFLLHTLKVFMYPQRDSNSIPNLLDDKKLYTTFENVIKYNNSKENFSKGFIICLLKTRFLFDKYIIKREYLADNSDGEWSLKSIDTSGQQSNKKAYVKNTYNNNNKNENTENIMIQSALRVSYTSPRVMHWITELLCELYYQNSKYTNNYARKAEEIAKEQTKDFLRDNVNFSMGEKTPHIVLNFLDYIIWKNNQDKYKDFVFEFRNSVEHWYPQNPSEGTIPRWDDDKNNSIDRFGNLCLVQRAVNSRFSNMPPEAKKSTFEKMISKGSLKLRIMNDKTTNNQDWKNTTCKKHEKDMIELLQDAVKK